MLCVGNDCSEKATLPFDKHGGHKQEDIFYKCVFSIMISPVIVVENSKARHIVSLWLLRGVMNNVKAVSIKERKSFWSNHLF